MEDMLIPLHDYINDPIAQDVIHNGATFQVLQFAQKLLDRIFFF